MKHFAVYTACRLGLFVACYAIEVAAYVLVSGQRHIPVLWPFIVAIVVSSVASYFVLSPQRARFAEVIDRRARKATAAFEAARAKEDEDE